MGVYSEINLDRINEILKYYDLGEAVQYSSTIEGISNSNYRVTLDNDQTVLLKVSNDKTVDQLQNEQQILQVLKKYNYSYSLPPFETILGKAIYTHGDYYGVVFPFINGFPPVINEDTIFQIGKALGQLHSLEIHKEDLELIRPHDLVGYGGLSISDYASNSNAASDFAESFNKMFPCGLQELPYDLFPAGIIHGDLYFDNSLFYDNKLITLIDFEQAGRGRFILDIGIAISGSCLNEEKTNIDIRLMDSFLRGYEEDRHLILLEREYLNLAIIVGFYSIGLWRIKRFYEGNLDSEKKYNYRELLKRAVNFKDKFGLNL